MTNVRKVEHLRTRVDIYKTCTWYLIYPGESPTYIFHDEYIQNTRERPTMKLEELSTNNHIVDVIHKHHSYYTWNMAQARPMNVSYVPPILQS